MEGKLRKLERDAKRMIKTARKLEVMSRATQRELKRNRASKPTRTARAVRTSRIKRARRAKSVKRSKRAKRATQALFEKPKRSLLTPAEQKSEALATRALGISSAISKDDDSGFLDRDFLDEQDDDTVQEQMSTVLQQSNGTSLRLTPEAEKAGEAATEAAQSVLSEDAVDSLAIVSRAQGMPKSAVYSAYQIVVFALIKEAQEDDMLDETEVLRLIDSRAFLTPDRVNASAIAQIVRGKRGHVLNRIRESTSAVPISSDTNSERLSLEQTNTAMAQTLAVTSEAPLSRKEHAIVAESQSVLSRVSLKTFAKSVLVSVALAYLFRTWGVATQSTVPPITLVASAPFVGFDQSAAAVIGRGVLPLWAHGVGTASLALLLGTGNLIGLSVFLLSALGSMAKWVGALQAVWDRMWFNGAAKKIDDTIKGHCLSGVCEKITALEKNLKDLRADVAAGRAEDRQSLQNTNKALNALRATTDVLKVSVEESAKSSMRALAQSQEENLATTKQLLDKIAASPTKGDVDSVLKQLGALGVRTDDIREELSQSISQSTAQHQQEASRLRETFDATIKEMSTTQAKDRAEAQQLLDRAAEAATSSSDTKSDIDSISKRLDALGVRTDGIREGLSQSISQQRQEVSQQAASRSKDIDSISKRLDMLGVSKADVSDLRKRVDGLESVSGSEARFQEALDAAHIAQVEGDQKLEAQIADLKRTGDWTQKEANRLRVDMETKIQNTKLAVHKHMTEADKAQRSALEHVKQSTQDKTEQAIKTMRKTTQEAVDAVSKAGKDAPDPEEREVVEEKNVEAKQAIEKFAAIVVQPFSGQDVLPMLVALPGETGGEMEKRAEDLVKGMPVGLEFLSAYQPGTVLGERFGATPQFAPLEETFGSNRQTLLPPDFFAPQQSAPAPAPISYAPVPDISYTSTTTQSVPVFSSDDAISPFVVAAVPGIPPGIQGATQPQQRAVVSQPTSQPTKGLFERYVEFSGEVDKIKAQRGNTVVPDIAGYLWSGPSPDVAGPAPQNEPQVLPLDTSSQVQSFATTTPQTAQIN